MVRRIDNGKQADLETLERLDRARSFIDHCYDHPLSLDQISEKACFSRYHFLRLFREAFNKTPHQYIIERRIEAGFLVAALAACRRPLLGTAS